MIRRPPRSTRTDTLFPYTTLFRSKHALAVRIEGHIAAELRGNGDAPLRSEEHTSELQSLMRISYAVFCLKKKNQINDEMERMNMATTNHSLSHHRYDMHKSEIKS